MVTTITIGDCPGNGIELGDFFKRIEALVKCYGPRATVLIKETQFDEFFDVMVCESIEVDNG
jgi:hypothetical protein